SGHWRANEKGRPEGRPFFVSEQFAGAGRRRRAKRAEDRAPPTGRASKQEIRTLASERQRPPERAAFFVRSSLRGPDAAGARSAPRTARPQRGAPANRKSGHWRANEKGRPRGRPFSFRAVCGGRI